MPTCIGGKRRKGCACGKSFKGEALCGSCCGGLLRRSVALVNSGNIALAGAYVVATLVLTFAATYCAALVCAVGGFLLVSAL